MQHLTALQLESGTMIVFSNAGMCNGSRDIEGILDPEDIEDAEDYLERMKSSPASYSAVLALFEESIKE